VGESGQLARELVGQDPVRRDAAPGEALELLDLAGLEAVEIAEEVDGRPSEGGDG
jgi:hypothetical protein